MRGSHRFTDIERRAIPTDEFIFPESSSSPSVPSVLVPMKAGDVLLFHGMSARRCRIEPPIAGAARSSVTTSAPRWLAPRLNPAYRTTAKRCPRLATCRWDDRLASSTAEAVHAIRDHFGLAVPRYSIPNRRLPPCSSVSSTASARAPCRPWPTPRKSRQADVSRRVTDACRQNAARRRVATACLALLRERHEPAATEVSMSRSGADARIVEGTRRARRFPA